MKTALTRRNFIALGGATAAAAAGASLFGCAPKDPAEGALPTSGAEGAQTFQAYADGRVSVAELELSVAEAEPIADFADEKTYDVVVVGAGTTGLPAALAALEEGATVAVLQKEANPVAQGMLAARVVKGKSTDVGIAQYVHEMHALNDHRPNLDLLKRYADASEEALQWYEAKLTEAGFSACKESDSKDHVYDDGNCYVMGLLFPDSMQAPTSALAELAAQKGVDFFYEILATGDYQNNEAMVDRYVADAQPFNRKQINKTGDGHLIGLLAGAVMEPGCHAKMIHGGAGCFREEPFLAVNINGERFMYEDVAYGARNTILRDQPEHRMITIFDANYSDQVYGWGSDPTVPTVANGTPEKIAGFVEKGVLLAADTLEELAEQIGVPADALVATVNRYNELCALGTDLDFGKASRYMQPIETAPFYGMPREYAIASIPAGLVVNTDGQCLNADGEPIRGLFAAGNCSGPFYSATDYSLSTMGLSVGRCITFGYLTGRTVAAL